MAHADVPELDWVKTFIFLIALKICIACFTRRTKKNADGATLFKVTIYPYIGVYPPKINDPTSNCI